MIIGDDMSKRYYVNNTDIFSIIDEFYPISINGSLNHFSFNNDNLNKFIDRIGDILEDVEVKDIKEEKIDLDDMDFLSDDDADADKTPDKDNDSDDTNSDDGGSGDILG